LLIFTLLLPKDPLIHGSLLPFLPFQLALLELDFGCRPVDPIRGDESIGHSRTLDSRAAIQSPLPDAARFSHQLPGLNPLLPDGQAPVTVDPLHHRVMGFESHLPVDEIESIPSPVKVPEHPSVHHCGTVVVVDDGGPVDVADKMTVIIVDSPEVPMPHENGVVEVVKRGQVDHCRGEAQGGDGHGSRPPIVIGVVGLVGGQGSPTDVGVAVDPRNAAWIPAI
jgi:hypothetical protein